MAFVKACYKCRIEHGAARLASATMAATPTVNQGSMTVVGLAQGAGRGARLVKRSWIR
jgi:hypothetical protein